MRAELSERCALPGPWTGAGPCQKGKKRVLGKGNDRGEGSMCRLSSLEQKVFGGNWKKKRESRFRLWKNMKVNRGVYFFFDG